jgi:hypothetical protein
LLNDAGFPRKALYELIETIAEEGASRVAVLQTLLQSQRRAGPSGPLLQQKDQEEFADLKTRVLRSKDYKPIVFHITKKAKQRVMNYKPFIPRDNSTETEGMLDINSIRYISSADVNWFMERDKIIVPKDIETVEMLEQLKRTQIWNFASRPADIKKVGPGCWQNILIVDEASKPSGKLAAECSSSAPSSSGR